MFLKISNITIQINNMCINKTLLSLFQEHHKRRRDGKQKEKRGKHEKRRSKKPKKELTDEQIERTYTGLDRELAEEFIDNTMEPGLSIQRAFSNSFEQDSF